LAIVDIFFAEFARVAGIAIASVFVHAVHTRAIVAGAVDTIVKINHNLHLRGDAL
jgi:hypothetical protein